MKQVKSKYKSYNTLVTALNRSHVKHSGRVATLLLDMFTQGDITEWQRIDKTILKNRGLIKESKNLDEVKDYRNYSEWRHDICFSGFLEWKLKDTGVNSTNKHLGGLFKPGEKLIPYLNKEMLKLGQVALKSDIYALNEKNERLSERVSLLEKVILKDIEKEDPPATKEKLERKLKLLK